MDTPAPSPPDPAAKPAADRIWSPAARRLLVRTLRWHLAAFVAVNLLLTGINIFIGGWWWAFWPLTVTAALLAIHYFFYKATAADERWATERVEELNLKSYDRSHIEDLKSRYGGGDDRRDRQL